MQCDERVIILGSYHPIHTKPLPLKLRWSTNLQNMSLTQDKQISNEKCFSFKNLDSGRIVMTTIRTQMQEMKTIIPNDYVYYLF